MWHSGQITHTDSSSRGTFSTFMTPTIVKVLYICVQIAIVIMAMGATQRYDSGVVLVTAIVVSLLWRIVCEETVLFFTMQNTLTSIAGRLDTLI